jgi:hypothetical protein
MLGARLVGVVAFLGDQMRLALVVPPSRPADTARLHLRHPASRCVDPDFARDGAAGH